MKTSRNELALCMHNSPPAALHMTGEGDLPAYYPVTTLITASVAVQTLSHLLSLRDGSTSAVNVDRRLASLWCQSSIKPDGWEIPPVWDSLAGDYATADSWIRLHTNAPAHRNVVETVLGKANYREALAPRVALWKKAELEQAVVLAGGCAAQMCSASEWQQHVQGKSLVSEPLFQRALCPPATLPAWALGRERPLAGVRVLDLTRIIAGSVATRFLAGLGADVLRIDPFCCDAPGQEADVTLGKRCARLNPHNPQDKHRFETLLREADVIVHGYRAGALHKLGYGSEQRRGFDSLVQMSYGIAQQGMQQSGENKPVPLPVQALDHVTGYLMATEVIQGLAQHVETHQGSETRLSLARTARELMTSGAQETAPASRIFAAQAEDYSSQPEYTVSGSWAGGYVRQFSLRAPRGNGICLLLRSARPLPDGGRRSQFTAIMKTPPCDIAAAFFLSFF